ncbi:hypothetical protein TKK_0016636 [Trichogramma kaykai]|uniref:Uncharacterized protein n=1 Tax=Trichogramma kaykai TaxID=54128 RepID=A0ABD2W6C6_9HYME
MSTEDNILPQERGSDLQLPAPNSVVESLTSFSRRNSTSSIASNVSDAGSESKKRKVIEEDHEMGIESDFAKANPCLATRFEDLEDKTMLVWTA